MSVSALGDIGDNRSVEPLIAILEDEGTAGCSHLRLVTCWALGKLKDAKAVESLVNIVNGRSQEQSWMVEAAATALLELDDDRIELPLLKYYRGKLNSIINSEISVQDEKQGILEGVVKLITRLIDKS